MRINGGCMEDKDSYGSTHREIMKRILEKPAAEFRPLNRRNPEPSFLAVAFSIALFIALVCAFVYGTHALWLRFTR